MTTLAQEATMEQAQCKTPVRAELARASGQSDGAGAAVPDVIGQAMQQVPDPVLRGEWDFVLRLFEDLKRYGEAELRISVTPGGPARQTEIIYAGIHQKRSLGPLRRLYKARDRSRDVIRG